MTKTEVRSSGNVRLNERVRRYWEREPCGTHDYVVTGVPEGSPEWFQRIEEYRYAVEPFIHSVAQFTRYRGRRILEVGVGAGTDHLQWARAGANCHGVDLTDAAINTTRKHLELNRLSSDLRRADAESLPFDDGVFDLVYSWGVIHHSERPERIVGEIYRVLRPGGEFRGMMYGRRSVVAARLWVKYALLRGKPWRRLDEVIWHHVESVGTKAYTLPELAAMFGQFTTCELDPILTVYDTRGLPRWLNRHFPPEWGWFVGIRCRR